MLCKHGVAGSNPTTSTNKRTARRKSGGFFVFVSVELARKLMNAGKPKGQLAARRSVVSVPPRRAVIGCREAESDYKKIPPAADAAIGASRLQCRGSHELVHENTGFSAGVGVNSATRARIGGFLCRSWWMMTVAVGQMRKLREAAFHHF